MTEPTIIEDEKELEEYLREVGIFEDDIDTVVNYASTSARLTPPGEDFWPIELPPPEEVER